MSNDFKIRKVNLFGMEVFAVFLNDKPVTKFLSEVMAKDWVKRNKHSKVS